jgi:flagellar L-ring protein FlgH
MSRFGRLAVSALTLAILCAAAPVVASSADLFTSGNWPAMASDRPALKAGDSLTIVIDETSTASNSAKSGSSKKSHFGGIFSFGAVQSGSLDMGTDYSGSGQTQRVHKMIAEISVVVVSVLANGDLVVSGTQAIKINGEHTNIRLKGRVRPADISADNTVLSTRLADAVIDYDGSGFIDSNNRPGLLTRFFNWLGLP